MNGPPFPPVAVAVASLLFNPKQPFTDCVACASTAFGGPVPDYDASSQQYDFIARDAQTGTAGNQQYLVVFSAVIRAGCFSL